MNALEQSDRPENSLFNKAFADLAEVLKAKSKGWSGNDAYVEARREVHEMWGKAVQAWRDDPSKEPDFGAYSAAGGSTEIEDGLKEKFGETYRRRHSPEIQ